MENEDFLLALKLQREFENEVIYNEEINKQLKRKHSNDCVDGDGDNDLNRTCNLVHPEWETLDPTPDVKALFVAFDNKFFQRRLKCVELEWSKKMYSCAGICYMKKNRLGMAITIRLSEPLLKLRSRKDLIETLLHEMIHAYCCVLGIREENGGHGPNFKKIMNGINKVAGTNITVYHSFYDEVNEYKTHWWRCNGICQNRKPFFGYVKRTSNRAPGPNDIWWRQHLESCGGSFLKIKEPEKKKLKSENKKTLNNPKNNIKTYFPVQNKSNKDNSTTGIQSIVDSTIIKPSSLQSRTSTPPKSNTKTCGNQNNIVGFKDLSGEDNNRTRVTSSTKTMTGTGYSLTTETITSNSLRRNEHQKNVKEKLRDIWSQKFPKTKERETVVTEAGSSADHWSKVEVPFNMHDKKPEDSYWKLIDEDGDIMIKEDNNSVINVSSSEDEDDKKDVEIKTGISDVEYKPVKKEGSFKSSQDRQKEIKQEILESSDLNLTEDDIEIIDDEFDELLNNSCEIADTSLIEDLFGDDTLLKDFQTNNSVVAATGDPRYHKNPEKDIITCPICQENLSREHLSDHLDGCSGMRIPIPGPSTSNAKKPRKTIKHKVYEESNSEEINDTQAISSGPENEETVRRRVLHNNTHSCPVCAQEVDIDKINEHLDICLKF